MTVKLENNGTGIMPVEVAATRGERFAKDGTPERPITARHARRSPWARASRATWSSPARSSPSGSSSTPTPRSFSSGGRVLWSSF